jgi:hypothetical protein
LEAVLGATSGVKQALLVSVKEEEQRPIHNCRLVSGLRPFYGPIRNPVKKGPGPETIYHFGAEAIY